MYIYIYIHIHENNVPFQLSTLLVITIVALWQPLILSHMSCHKVIVVITARTHCFYDCIFITSIFLKSK